METEMLKQRVGFPPNIRAYIIGSSETGKTYQIIKLLKRQILKCNDVWVISNNSATLNQPLYKTIPDNKKILLSGVVKKPNFRQDDFVIIDDIDSFPKNSWLSSLATVESHHSNLSVVYICHKWKTGNVELRGSVEFVFLFYNPVDIYNDVVKELGLDDQESRVIQKHLATPKGVKQKKGVENSFKNHNHVLIDRRYPYIKTKKGLEKRSRISSYDVGGYYTYDS